MSGHKRTTVSLGDMDVVRIQGLEERLKTVEKDYDKILKKVRQGQEEEFNKINSKFRQGEQEFQRIIQTISDQTLTDENNIFALQENFNIALNDEVNHFQQQILEVQTGINQNTTEMIDDFGNQMIRFIDNFFSERDSEIDYLRQDYLSKAESQQKIAFEAVQSAHELLDYITSQYPVDRYYPNEIKEIINGISQSRKNIEDGFYEAGLVAAQQINRELERIRLLVSEKELTRQYYLAITRKECLELREIAKSYQTVNAIGLDHEDLGIELDVSFWSGNRYRTVIKKISSMINQIENFGESFDEAELRTFLADHLPILREELDQSVYWARRNVLASQIRFNIASRVVQALGEQGFVLSSGNYAESDQRCLYQVHLRHLDGSEVIVEVKEIENEMSVSQLELESLDANVRTEHELRQRAFEVARALRQYGLQVGKNLKREEKFSSPFINSNTIVPQNTSKKRISEEKVVYGRN